MTVSSRAATVSPETALVARGSVINALGMALGAVFAFALTVLVSRWLQPGNAGGLFELIAIFMIASNILELGADTGLTRWISRARATSGLAEVRRVVWIALIPVAIVGAAAAAGMWLAAPWLAAVFLHGIDPATAVREVHIVVPLVPLGALSNCVIAGPRGFDRMWPYLAIEGVGKPVIRLLLVLIALLMGWGLQGALIAWCLPIVVGLVAAWLILSGLIRAEPAAAPRRGGAVQQSLPSGPAELQAGPQTFPAGAAPGPRPGPSPPPAAVRKGKHRTGHGARSAAGQRLAREFWGFSAPRGLAGAFQIVVLWLDVLLVGALMSRYAAGVYAAVSKLVIVGTYALQAQRLAIGPQLSALLARGQNRRAEALFQGATRLVMLIAWPLYVMFMIFPSVILGIFGPKYASGATALCILSGAMLVNLGTGNVTVALLMGGKSVWNAVNAFAAVTVNIVLNLVLIPRMGIAGAAVAWAASIVVDNVAAVIEVKWTLGLATFGPGYGLAAAASAGCFAVTGLAARAALGETLPALAIACAAGTAVYGAVLYAARSRLEIGELIAAVRMRRGRSVINGSGGRRPGGVEA